jgi:large subunit ribosomal protein L9
MARTVELLLTENIDNLGIVGDVVKVKPGYARNYLVPMGYAVPPTEGAKKALAERRAQVEHELAELRKQLEALVEKLEDYEISLERSCNDQGWLYGSVHQRDIVEVLHAEGFTAVRERHVRIGTTIKRIDSYEIPIQFDRDLGTQIKLWVVADRELNLDAPSETIDEEPVAEADADAPAAKTIDKDE